MKFHQFLNACLDVGLAPFRIKTGTSSLDGGFNILCVGKGNVCDSLAGSWVDHWKRFVIGNRLDDLSADKVLESRGFSWHLWVYFLSYFPFEYL